MLKESLSEMGSIDVVMEQALLEGQAAALQSRWFDGRWAALKLAYDASADDDKFLGACNRAMRLYDELRQTWVLLRRTTQTLAL